MLPRETYARLLTEYQVLGLKMKIGGAEERVFFFRVDVVEGPNDLLDHSIGAASAQATAGTGWNTITNAAGNRLLEPEYENQIYHVFMGVSPGQAWVYRQYPAARDINSLYGTKAVGDAIGFIDGWKSPYRSPSPISELFVLKGTYPQFLGYNPYTEPASITVRLAFYVSRYIATFLGVDAGARKVAAVEDRARAKIRPVGGRDLAPVPTWLQSIM